MVAQAMVGRGTLVRRVPEQMGVTEGLRWPPPASAEGSDTLHVSVISPRATIYEGEADEVIAPTYNGSAWASCAATRR